MTKHLRLPPTATLSERFYAGVPQQATETGCLEWTRGRFNRGYGGLAYQGRTVKAHRVSWQLYNNRTIPGGMVVRHKCDNPACINPEHLELGTHADNTRDRQERNRQVKGSNHSNAKLTEETVAEIKRSLSLGATARELARKYGVTSEAILKIKRGKTWRHVTTSWFE